MGGRTSSRRQAGSSRRVEWKEHAFGASSSRCAQQNDVAICLYVHSTGKFGSLVMFTNRFIGNRLGTGVSLLADSAGRRVRAARINKSAPDRYYARARSLVDPCTVDRSYDQP